MTTEEKLRDALRQIEAILADTKYRSEFGNLHVTVVGDIQRIIRKILQEQQDH